MTRPHPESHGSEGPSPASPSRAASAGGLALPWELSWPPPHTWGSPTPNLPSTAPRFPGKLLHVETEGVQAAGGALSSQVPETEGGLLACLRSIPISISPPNWADSLTDHVRGSLGDGMGRGHRGLASPGGGRRAGSGTDRWAQRHAQRCRGQVPHGCSARSPSQNRPLQLPFTVEGDPAPPQGSAGCARAVGSVLEPSWGPQSRGLELPPEKTCSSHGFADGAGGPGRGSWAAGEGLSGNKSPLLLPGWALFGSVPTHRPNVRQ